MPFRPTIAERAFELARSGECASVADVRTCLRKEGYIHVASHLSGSSITGPLRLLCEQYRKAGSRPASAPWPFE